MEKAGELAGDFLRPVVATLYIIISDVRLEERTSTGRWHQQPDLLIRTFGLDQVDRPFGHVEDGIAEHSATVPWARPLGGSLLQVSFPRDQTIPRPRGRLSSTK